MVTTKIDDDMVMLPPLQDQAKFVALKRAQDITAKIAQLTQQPAIDIPLEVDENDYPKTHLLTKETGWQAPDPDLVKAYFAQLKAYNKQYTEAGIAKLLGMADSRIIRRFKSGERKVPYDVWRRFLVATGRAPMDEPTLVGFLDKLKTRVQF